MTVSLADVIALLERGPDAVRAVTGSLDPAWSERRPAPESWSAFEIVCHMTYVEEVDWMPRVRMIFREGESRPFDPVDHGLRSGPFEGMSIDTVIDRFAEVRAANLAELQALDLAPADLERRGTHPSLGTVTLGMLLATWVGHDLNHLAQIESALAYRYELEVGPWRSFLGILERAP